MNRNAVHGIRVIARQDLGELGPGIGDPVVLEGSTGSSNSPLPKAKIRPAAKRPVK